MLSGPIVATDAEVFKEYLRQPADANNADTRGLLYDLKSVPERPMFHNPIPREDQIIWVVSVPANGRWS
jgi:hypothetical protein